MKFIPNSVTRAVGRQVLVAKKNSPHIFFVGGVFGIIGSTVLACRATLHLEEKIDEIKADLEDVKVLSHSASLTDGQTYTEADYRRNLGYAYSKSALKLARLYAPSAILGGVSIAALTGSHIQLTRRNAALTVTLAAVSKAFDDYRIRVQEEIGKERELEIHRAIHDEKVEIDGKKETVKVFDSNKWSPYMRIFDETSWRWEKNPEINRIFLQAQQNYYNQKLQARGHVFLNEVYDALGLEHSQAGSVVGWLSHGDGDCFIDFGIFEAYNSRFVNGLERSVILDFNVDGVIYDKIQE